MKEHSTENVGLDILWQSDGPAVDDTQEALEAIRTTTYALLRMWRSRFVADQPIDKSYAPHGGDAFTVQSAAEDQVHAEVTKPDGIRHQYVLDGTKPLTEELSVVTYPVDGDPHPSASDIGTQYEELSQLLFLSDRAEARG